MFLGKYKMMLGADCKLIYNTKDYHRKRLKVLEKEKYIRRVNTLYIKLDDKGTKLVRKFGYEYNNKCRRKEYIDRLNEVAKIAALTINTKIDFIASWNLKDNNIYTETSRKYIGKMIFQGKETIVYYISKDRDITYTSQIVNDVQKIINYDNIIIFMENTNYINEKQRFVFGKESTLIIKPTNENFKFMKILENIDYYKVIQKIYINTEILLSNWKKANYMTEDRRYIIIMPFVDTEKLHGLNVFYKNNQNTDRKINIITLRENKEKINEILTNRTDIIEMDNWLGGIDEEESKG
jgi:hypothetical protein